MATSEPTHNNSPEEISIQQLLEALLDEATPLHPRYLNRFSDLEGEDALLLGENWKKIALWRRQALMEDLPVLADNDYLLSFEAVGRIAVRDPDPLVRFGGIQAFIASESESHDLINVLLNLAESDLDSNVRAAAASALGKFVYIGELELLPESDRSDLEDRLIKISEEDSYTEVRRNALESLGFSSRDGIQDLIANAYQSSDPAWVASALFAMGRSADETWSEEVFEHLTNPNDQIRLEAVRAAGELGLLEARKVLVSSLGDPNDEVRLAAIWSLSQLGGEGIAEIFASLLKNASDDDEIILIEQALDNLAFNSDTEDGFGMFYIPDPDEGEEDQRWIIWDGLDEDLDDPESLYMDMEDTELEPFEELEDEDYNGSGRSINDLIYIEDDIDEDEDPGD
jgi:HEAT repeat protein